MDIDINKSEQDTLHHLKVSIKECEDLHLFSTFMDDKFLLHFVRGKKYDSKRAFITVQNYFRLRKEKYNLMFKSLRPSKDPIFRKGILRVLKNLDHLNRIVIVIHFGLWDPLEVSIDEFCGGVVLFVEEAWNREEVEKNGIVAIVDVETLGWQQAKLWTPSQLKKFMNIFWSNFPLKYKAIYIVKNKAAYSLIYNAVRPFLPKKLQDRLYLCGDNMENLHANISLDILPKFLGGQLNEDEVWDQDFVKRIMEKEDYYQRLAQLL